ncbi:metalloregulator ArsR/SmtB family transcription factor [Acinetobacter sp. MD2]|uniref:metalloregulator ArsR/SmtB family transcription factor n=1 Tax=Acinetobacter sp. MD2 TaxID=2600066 RepID=UPI002D1EAB43|nr:metalloregulator ArsR/SmtB family transcription factor [Acinetobacter sp. MD2]MEB3766485.1 helix-turn-helix transcriptional regulator [Acinetobacter sp. MD2]
MTEELKVEVIRELSDDIVSILKSLANKDRLLILTLLLKDELNVSEIETRSSIQQPTLSQQLMILRKNDVVKTRRAGKQIFYSIKDERFIQILNNIYQFHHVV